MMQRPFDADRTPGALSDLLAFYALVPVAEQLDLATSDHSGEQRADLHVPLTEGQVIGLLEHVLGAELIEEHPHISPKP